MSDLPACDGMPCVGTGYIRLLTAERDSARNVAVRLEQECAHLTETIENMRALLAGVRHD